MNGRNRILGCPGMCLSFGLVLTGVIILFAAASSTGSVMADMPDEMPHSLVQQAEEQGDYFVTAAICGDCHNDIQDESGADISFDAAWRSSIMANASNDPYWLASVRRETMANPAELAPVIENICATCHMPMAQVTAAFDEKLSPLLGDGGYADPAHPLNVFAIEGVSCTICHQIKPDNLGQHESFDGGFLIDNETPMGERVVYGTYGTERGVRQMIRGSGFAPLQSDHLASSELCATCHNLTTPFLDENDEIAGTIPEQMPYTEWLNSAYSDEQSCVDCHMLRVEGAAPITNRFDDVLRENVPLHHTTGGNNFILTILMENGLGENIGASSEEFQTAIDINREFLQNKTALLTLQNAVLADGDLIVDVSVENLAGHKLPTSYPSRRVWLHFTVTDSAGNVIFESGGYSEDGLIEGNNLDLDPATYEPHYTEITSTDQVQIYEAVMVNTLGAPTTTLLRGAAYVKDNRIPPHGFEKQGVPEDIMVRGAAESDADFDGGGDTVRYRIPLGDSSGPYQVSVALLYQSISYRWAMDLAGYKGDDAPEINVFDELYQQTPNVPERIAETTISVE